MTEHAKQAVYEFWNKASCGEDLYLQDISRESYEAHSAMRYRLEPEILAFARFGDAAGKDVLEIGVGLGADHANFAKHGARLTGIDLTDRAIEHTKRRLEKFGLKSNLAIGDAENLPFRSASFDMVYSWGVLHHSPNTKISIEEVHRVLRPGGVAKIMIYHKYSMVGYMLWIRYALLRLRPLTGLGDIYSQYLESPGTKAYSVSEARELFGRFGSVIIETHLTHADLLASAAGQRHRGPLLSVARWLWPRWLIKAFMSKHGLTMMISATK